MKRDFELIKKILLEFENLELNNTENEIIVDGYSNDQITYHAFLLNQAGLIDIIDTTSFDGKSFLPQQLTWYGHDFLDSIRNDKVWKNLMTKIKEKGGNIPFDIFVGLAKTLAEDFFKN